MSGRYAVDAVVRFDSFPHSFYVFDTLDVFVPAISSALDMKME